MTRRAFSVSAYCKVMGAVLLVNHKKQQAWVPIGGEVEAGETPLEALVREVEEEIGWVRGVDYTLPEISSISPPGFLAYEEHEAGPKGLHMNFAFLLEGTSRELHPCDEFTESAWVILSNEKENVPPNVRALLEVILEYGP